MITPYGPRAAEVAQRLTGIERAIVSEPERVGQAYSGAVAARVSGLPFYGMLLFEDQRSRIILSTTLSLCDQIADMDERRAAVEALCAGHLRIAGDMTSGELFAKPDELYEQSIGEFFALCDAILVRSNAEFLRLSALLKRPRRFEPIVMEALLPPFDRVKPVRPSVVVWSPRLGSSFVAIHALALDEFLADVTYVTGDGVPLPAFRGRFVRPGPEAIEALAAATCVVCVDPDDPGAAVAFARRGYGVVAPITAGAHEYVRDAVLYDMTKFKSIFTATQIAIAQPASLRALPVAPSIPARPPLPKRELLPRVSVVVPTYNRREDLGRALTCLQNQTYPNIEVLVVNDAGEDISDVVARFPIARLSTMPENSGVLRVITAGIAQTDGEFIQLLADDDWLSPDHIEGLVGALLACGGTIAHSNTLIRYEDLVPGGDPVTIGFNACVFNESTTPTDALIATPIAGNSLLFRRDLFEAIGPWRDDCILADQELQLRAANRFVMVYVDRMTAEWRARGSDNFSTTADSAGEMRRVFEELHPIVGRPYLQARRDASLAHVGSREKGVFAFPPTLTLKRS